MVRDGMMVAYEVENRWTGFEVGFVMGSLKNGASKYLSTKPGTVQDKKGQGERGRDIRVASSARPRPVLPKSYSKFVLGVCSVDQSGTTIKSSFSHCVSVYRIGTNRLSSRLGFTLLRPQRMPEMPEFCHYMMQPCGKIQSPRVLRSLWPIHTNGIRAVLSLRDLPSRCIKQTSFFRGQ
jgi:hypothetical protein